MKRRKVLIGLLVALALATLLSVGLGSGLLPKLRAADVALAAPLPDLESLLNYPNDVHIEDLTGAPADEVIGALVARPEATQLRMALGEAGYVLDLGGAEAMRVTLDDGLGGQQIVDVAIVPTVVGQQLFLPLLVRGYVGGAVHLAPSEWHQEIAELTSPDDSVAYLVAMVADDGSSFFQAHLTNLDPRLAQVPDPPFIVNGMPYFYITTLHIVDGRIIYWRYWWYDSHHHPNWYYAYYLHYWDFYQYGPHDWPWWYHWAHGWYYWRFWNYWSAWFPW